MSYILLKALLTGFVVVSVSEIAKRSSFLAAVLASLPLTSILAMVWMYIDSHDVRSTATLSTNIFWMVFPSLLFFLVFPLLVRWGFRFYPALLLACLAMTATYWIYTRALRTLGVEI